MVILVTGVRFDENDVISHIEWGEADSADPFAWTQRPHVTETSEIITFIHRGELVQTLFNIDGHNVLGPILIFDELAHSLETLNEGLPINNERSMRDLPRV